MPAASRASTSLPSRWCISTAVIGRKPSRPSRRNSRCEHLRRTKMKLYYNPMSPNVRRVRFTAAVLGIELEEKKLDFAKGEHKSPEYLALNPNGAVPPLVDGDLCLIT